MKNACTLFLFFIAVLFISCKKNDYRVRFTNNYSLQVSNIFAGTAGLGTVSPGQSSEYVSIPAGDFSITGQTTTGYLQGNGNISGKGTHKFTITLGADKKLLLTEDN
ncbi:MAG: hypothetical protein PSX36_01100 [bacterium]|nr:hypothetical protein [bacterium]